MRRLWEVYTLFPDPSDSVDCRSFNKTNSRSPSSRQIPVTLLRKLPRASPVRDHGSPPISKIVSLPFPKTLPRFWRGENALPPFPHFTLEFKCLMLCGYIVSTERSCKLPNLGSSRARCSPHQVPDRRGAPTPRPAAGRPRRPGLSRVRGAGRDGEGRGQHRRAPRPSPSQEPGGGRGGGGTAGQRRGALISALGARCLRGRPWPARAGPGLLPLPWHRPARRAEPAALAGRAGRPLMAPYATGPRGPVCRAGLRVSSGSPGDSAAERGGGRLGSISQEQELCPRFYPGRFPDLSFDTARPFHLEHADTERNQFDPPPWGLL